MPGEDAVDRELDPPVRVRVEGLAAPEPAEAAFALEVVAALVVVAALDAVAALDLVAGLVLGAGV